MSFIEEYFYAQPASEFVYNDPATNTHIEDLENRLGCQLPEDYKLFLLAMNGFEGEIGDFIVIFEPVENIYEQTQITCFEFRPWAIFIGSNGGGEMFVIDKRQSPAQFGLLPYISDEKDFIPLGNTFEQFLSRLKNDTAFDRL